MLSSVTAAPMQVLVVDDSAVVRQVMTAVLSQEPDMAVTVAADPLIAMQKMRFVRPDVILLDLEMPRMDGLTFLRKIMAEDPIPTLVCSGIAARGTTMALRALDEGALGIITKPKLGVGGFLHESALMLIDMVRSAAKARIKRNPHHPSLRAKPAVAASPFLPAPRSDLIIAIGASTGGTEALAQILTALPVEVPGIVIVQHMPEVFTAAFAARLNTLSHMQVKEGKHGEHVKPGCAIIAPGNRHMAVKRHREFYQVELSDGPLVSRHRPSVDVLFHSVAAVSGPNCLGIILTGMGNDGMAGMQELRKAGAQTVAQDEATCVVFGMPKEAIAAGAVCRVAPLSMIPAVILQWASSPENS